MMQNLGSNITPTTVKHSAKALGIIEYVCCQFAEDIGTEVKDFHTIPSVEKDLSRIQQQLIDQEKFKIKHGRQHSAYQNHKPLLQSINWEKFQEWVKERVNNYM